jgi:hypothetical protein
MQTPTSGEVFTQQNDSDAWQMCLEGENKPYVSIYVKSASTKCEASNNFIATRRDCNPGHSDQLWTETPASGGFTWRTPMAATCALPAG